MSRGPKSVPPCGTVVRSGSFGPTLEFERLPRLGNAGHARRLYRARAWRWILVLLALFWLAVGALVAGVIWG